MKATGKNTINVAATSRLTHWGLIVILSFSIFLVGWSPPHQQSLVVRVGYYENPPKLFMDANGDIQGFWPDLVNAIAEQEGWAIVWVPGTWEESLARLEKGEIDIMPDVAWNQQRSLVYRFTETKVLVSWSRLYAKKDSGIETILDLEGKTVAGLKGSVNYDGAEGIKDLVQRFDVNVTFVDLNSYTEVFEAIQNGTIDAGITNKDFGNKNERNYSNLERTAFVFQPAYITFAFPRNGALTSQLMEAVDGNLRAFKADNDSIYYQSLGRYLEEEAAATETVIPSIPDWVKDVGLIGGGLVLFFLLTSVIARREVRRKTVELEREIRERKQAQLELESSEKYFRALTENGDDGIGVISEQGMVVYQSPASIRILGFTLEELTSQDVFKYVHPDDQDRSLGLFAQLIENPGKPVATQIRYRHKDGTWHWIETVGTNLLADASVHGIVVNFRDITDRKQAELELEQNRQWLENIFNALEEAVFVVTPQRELININPAAERIFEYSLAELQEKSTEILHVDHDHYVEFGRRIQAAFDQGQTANFEFQVKRKNGEVFPSEHTVALLKTKMGQPLGIISVVRDITERKRAEDALRASEEQFRQLAENIEDVFWIRTAGTGNMIYINPAYEKIWGRSAQSLYENRQAFMESIHPDDIEKVSGEYERTMQTGEFNLDYRIVRPDGTIRSIHARSFPIHDKNGNFIRTVGVATDITERKQAEDERNNLIAELSAKNTELEHFIYTVSHDLKAPLVTMKGFLGYLEQDAASGNVERIRGDTHRISGAVEKMQGLLGDLLELSRIGRFINPPEKIPFDELVSEAIDLVEGQITELGVKVDVQPDMPAVYGDKLRLLEVLQNLLDNAVKYMGNQAHPHVEVGNHNKDADSDLSIFFVRDNGMGIAPEYQEKVFGLFNKLDARSEGTGVGLALVKRIIEMHGGRVWIESEFGQGSVFYFTLPTAQH